MNYTDHRMNKLKNIFKFMVLSMVSLKPVLGMEEEDNFSTEEIIVVENSTHISNFDGFHSFTYNNQESADALFYEVINKFEDKISAAIKNNPKL